MGKDILKNDWAPLLQDDFSKDYYQELRTFLKEEYEKHTVYPKKEDIFNALHLTPYKNVKVVILGQDPYHGPNQAHGLSFSVKPQVSVPPSLRNIFKELQDDLNIPIPNNGHLTDWAEQGVLLLNNVLTVRKGEAHSHRGMGWERFTNQVINLLNNKETPVVYILWGSAAQKKEPLIDTSKHYIIKGPHPSPLSAYRGFFGSKAFSRTNELLEKHGLEGIDWSL